MLYGTQGESVELLKVEGAVARKAKVLLSKAAIRLAISRVTSVSLL